MKIEEYLSVSSAKARLLEILRKIEEQHSKVVITKNGAPKAILMNFEDFEGLLETVDILSDAETVRGIRKGLQDVKARRVVSLKEAFKD